jgi:hypothetical protein
MKKLIAVAILGLTAVSGWAQGTVDFRNGGITFPTDNDRRVYLGAVPTTPGGGIPLTGTTWVAGLWYLPGADKGAQIGTASQVGGRTFAFRPDTTALKGYWVAPAGVSPIFTFPDVAVGASATLQVRVWDSAKYNSYDAAVAGGQYGASAPFNYTVPAAGSTPDKYYMDNLRAFGVVPEPSTIALGLLGVAGLLFLRRRK